MGNCSRSPALANQLQKYNISLDSLIKKVTFAANSSDNTETQSTQSMKDLQKWARPCIWKLAEQNRSEENRIRPRTGILLDANESPYHTPLNRYPDPSQHRLREAVSRLKGVSSDELLMSNGSTTMVDFLFRCFCRPGIDNAMSFAPTAPLYARYAAINEVEYRTVPPDAGYQLNATRLLAACNDRTKLVWLCSPNNPTGNNLNRKEMERVIAGFDGIVVVDERYADFSMQKTFRNEIHRYPNLVVLNSMSHAWGCAALSLSMVFARKELIDFFLCAGFTSPVSLPVEEKIVERLEDPYEVERWVKLLLQERDRLMEAFRLLPVCEEVFPSDANFFLAKMKDAQRIYTYLANKNIMVSNQSMTPHCEECLRITIGTRTENTELLSALRQFE